MHIVTSVVHRIRISTLALLLGLSLAGCDQPAPETQPPADAAVIEDTQAPAAEAGAPQAPPIVGDEELPANHPPIGQVAPATPAMPEMPAGHPPLPEMAGAMDAEAESDEEEEMEHPEPSGADIPYSVPEGVQVKWATVLLEVTGADGASQELRAAIGDEIQLAGGQSLLVEAFLPAYISDFEKITSASDELKNPAVKVQLRQDGETKATGWVFQNLPEYNNYRSEQVQVRLLGAEAAGNTQ